MGRTACTEPQCLYKGALYLYLTVELYLYSPYGPYGLYRASVPVQGVHFTFFSERKVHKFTWLLKAKHYMSMDATDQDWDNLIVAIDACNYESVGYMGPIDDFVLKDSKKY